MSESHDNAGSRNPPARSLIRWVSIGAGVVAFAAVLAWALHLGRADNGGTQIDTNDLGATTSPAPAPEPTPPSPPPPH